MMKRQLHTFALFLISVTLYGQCDTTWYTGEGTQYGGIAGTNGGNCGIFVVKDDFRHCAMNHTQYDSSYACGACVRVIGPLGEINLKVVDRCPECKPGDIDLSTDAFTSIAKLEDGRVKIQWQYIPCQDNDKTIKMYIDNGSSPYYFKALFYDIKHRIKTVEWKTQEGKYIPIHREMYNYFVALSGIDEGRTECGPYTFRITDEYGNMVYAYNISYKTGEEIDLGVQFPDCEESNKLNDSENSLLWSNDLKRIEVFDLLGRHLNCFYNTTDYLSFAEQWNKIHIIKLHFSSFCKVEIHK